MTAINVTNFTIVIKLVQVCKTNSQYFKMNCKKHTNERKATFILLVLCE